MTDVHYLLMSAALAWIMIMVAAELRTPTWTRAGARLAFGNREVLPEASALAARADRAARNMSENLILFVAVFVAARTAGVDAERDPVRAFGDLVGCSPRDGRAWPVRRGRAVRR